MTTFVLVSADFALTGGMDRANYELAWHIAERVGAGVYLVSHAVSAPLAHHPNVAWHRVPRPFGRNEIGERLLACHTRRIVRALDRSAPRVVVNGGNCIWPDLNWVHAVHAAWRRRDDHAPLWWRIRSALVRRHDRAAERRALRAARMIVTNSSRARTQVIDRLAIEADRVHAIYYGVDPNAFRPATAATRRAARQRLGRPDERPIVLFIGALGYDRNKGFDVLFESWRRLCADREWDADLIAVGHGAEVPFWRASAAAAGLDGRVQLVGYTATVPELMTAADALVSPTHYDAYGLAVHEALCCGLPAFVTRTAGVAERYPVALEDLLLPDPPSVADLVDRLRAWRTRRAEYQARVASFGAMLRQRAWADMARDIIAVLEDSRPLKLSASVSQVRSSTDNSASSSGFLRRRSLE